MVSMSEDEPRNTVASLDVMHCVPPLDEVIRRANQGDPWAHSILRRLICMAHEKNIPIGSKVTAWLADCFHRIHSAEDPRDVFSTKKLEGHPKEPKRNYVLAVLYWSRCATKASSLKRKRKDGKRGPCESVASEMAKEARKKLWPSTPGGIRKITHADPARTQALNDLLCNEIFNGMADSENLARIEFLRKALNKNDP